MTSFFAQGATVLCDSGLVNGNWSYAKRVRNGLQEARRLRDRSREHPSQITMTLQILSRLCGVMQNEVVP